MLIHMLILLPAKVEQVKFGHLMQMVAQHSPQTEQRPYIISLATV